MEEGSDYDDLMDASDDSEIKSEDSDDDDVIKEEGSGREIKAEDSDDDEIKEEESDNNNTNNNNNNNSTNNNNNNNTNDAPSIKDEYDCSSDYGNERSFRADALASDYSSSSDEEDIKSEYSSDHGLDREDDLLDDHIEDDGNFPNPPNATGSQSNPADAEDEHERTVFENLTASEEEVHELPFSYHDHQLTVAAAARDRYDFLGSFPGYHELDAATSVRIRGDLPGFPFLDGHGERPLCAEDDGLWDVLAGEEDDWRFEQDGFMGGDVLDDSVWDEFGGEDEVLRYEEEYLGVQMVGEFEGVYVEDGVTDAFGLGSEGGEGDFEDEEDEI
ncbi:alpha,alpha-trehalase nth1 [Podospora pseudoanserina]|uniref:Alpha,alpha-trehalase nth1 n=1 Tax=Podospora pseudoanserina TaxID=2609844 RepID=A0ABR0IFN5_9PEZI|nr:alpha,alpha-trehalase nth1 [Podospora pseudoanserina]